MHAVDTIFFMQELILSSVKYNRTAFVWIVSRMDMEQTAAQQQIGTSWIKLSSQCDFLRHQMCEFPKKTIRWGERRRWYAISTGTLHVIKHALVGTVVRAYCRAKQAVIHSRMHDVVRHARRTRY
jgi:hypothetical protein